MNGDKVENVLDVLEEVYHQIASVIQGIKEKSGAIVAGVPCPFIPYELLACHNIIPLMIPPRFFMNKCAGRGKHISSNDMYDILIFPEKCCGRTTGTMSGSPGYMFKNPRGYGESFLIQFHDSIDNLMQEIARDGFNVQDNGNLAEKALLYNSVRTAVRKIRESKRQGNSFIKFSSLYRMYEFSLSLPPEIVIHYLDEISDLMSGEIEMPQKNHINLMVYSSSIPEFFLLDEIENTGFVIYEDDLCNGGRYFDLSVDPFSKTLDHDITESFSWSPGCPCTRTAMERYELLYSMIKKFNIDLVCFIKDLSCPEKIEHIDFLRRKLMRSCVDSIVINSDGLLYALEVYGRKTGLKG